jgi:hypothetical protein
MGFLPRATIGERPPRAARAQYAGQLQVGCAREPHPAGGRPPGRRQDLQALRRRRVPALRVRPQLPGHRHQGQAARARRAGLPQGRPRRGERGQGGAARLVGRHGVQPWAGALPGRRRCCRRAARGSSRTSSPAEGISRKKAGRGRRRRVDRWVWYAGWTDKIATVLGSVNPVAGPYVNFSTPVPTGVDRGARACRLGRSPGWSTCWPPCSPPAAPPSWSRRRSGPLPAVELAEVLATVDVPGGVVNLLTGRVAELGPWLAAHADVDGLDLAGAPEDIAVDLERAGGRYREARAAAGNHRRAGPAARLDGADDGVAPGGALVSGPWPATSSPSSSRSPRATSSRCGHRDGARTARNGRRSSATTTRSSRSRPWPSSPRSSAPSPSTTWPTTRRGRWCRTSPSPS